jgi:hypothetical protein
MAPYSPIRPDFLWGHLSGPFWNLMANFNTNLAGFCIAGLFVAVWAAALIYWRVGNVEDSIANARPLQPLPAPLGAPDRIASLDIRRRDRLGGVVHEYQHAA